MAGENEPTVGSAEWLAMRVQQKLDAGQGVPADDQETAPPAPDPTPDPEPAAEVAPPPPTEPTSEPAGDPLEAGTAEDAADRAEAELGSDATDEEVANAREEAAQEFYAGRYKTREAVEDALKEQIALIGRQGQELGQLRKQMDEQAAAAEVAPEEPQQLDREAWNSWAEEQVDNGAGAEGALAALREGGYAGYEIYLGKWLVSEDPQEGAAAVLFNNAMMMKIQEEQRAQDQVAAAPQYDPNTENDTARTMAASKRADWEEVQPYMNDALAQMDPDQREWLSSLAESGVEGKVRALDLLYLEAKARSGGSKQLAAQVASRQTAAATDRAKLDASDTPSIQSRARTPLSEADQVALDYGNARRKIWGTPLKEG